VCVRLHSRLVLPLLLLLGAAFRPAHAQVPVLTSELLDGSVVDATRSLDIEASRALNADERLAVFVDGVDITPVLRATATKWTYDAAALPLQAGERELLAWIIVRDSVWHEALRVRFRVPGALDIDSAAVQPTLELGLKSRLASTFRPAAPGERSTFNDVDGRFELTGGLSHYGGLRFSTRAQFVGHSERNRALRFGDLQDDAPLVDLTSYVAEIAYRGVQLSAGNLSSGRARHLIQSFPSRGVGVALRTDRIQFEASGLHGSNLVGWSDPLGLGEPDHRILTASLGLDALRDGALRFELSTLNGSVLPRTGFNRGAITDAERSRGHAVALQSELFDRRVRLEAGLTSSRFDNPVDPEMAADTALVAVAEDTHTARYLLATVTLLRARSIGRGRTAALTSGFSHERIDPLFRSVAAFVRADQLQNRWELRADVAGITIAGNHTRAHNNLDGIPSILTSHTRRSGLDAALPLATVLRSRAWLPAFRFRADRVHQFGAGVPVNGGFSETHVPDQVSLDLGGSVDVRLPFGALLYRHDRSRQDNRQTGRENADLERTTHAVRATASPVRRVSASLDIAWIQAFSVERNETDDTRRIGASLDLMPFAESVLGIQLAMTRIVNDVRQDRRDDLGWSAQWASPVPGLRRFGGKLLLRFSHADHTARQDDDRVRRENWMVDLGLNLRIR
jgi:hypothetical protein